MTRPSPDAVTLRLAPALPYDWESLHRFLARRAVTGVEAASPGTYARSLRLSGAVGSVAIRFEEGVLAAELRLSDPERLAEAAARLRRLLDVDADVAAIAERLGPLARRPGLRVPGCWDGFELAVRAILGQQVSVAGAATLAGRLVALHGELLPEDWARPGVTRLFPTAAAMASAELESVGLTRARAEALRRLAQAVVADPGLLAPDRPHADTRKRLLALPGVGPWTVDYVAMRALRDPDAFPAGDLALRKALAEGGAPPGRRDMEKRAEAWRPWRAYAAMQLWMTP